MKKTIDGCIKEMLDQVKTATELWLLITVMLSDLDNIIVNTVLQFDGTKIKIIIINYSDDSKNFKT